MTETKPFKPLSKKDVADILGVTIRTVENHIDANILPEPVALGGRRYWHPDVFYNWLDKLLRHQSSSPSSTDSHGGQATKNGEASSKIVIDSADACAPRKDGSISKRARARDQRALQALEEGV